MAAKKSMQNRRTPRYLFEFLEQKFGKFVLDAFADSANALCDNFYTEQDNALVQPWPDGTFANPPFKLAGKCVDKALSEPGRSVLILPVGCSQKWAQRLIISTRTNIYMPDRRINFDLPDGTPTRGADRDTWIVSIHSGIDVDPGVCSLEIPRDLRLPCKKR